MFNAKPIFYSEQYDMPTISINAHWGPSIITLDCKGFEQLIELLKTPSTTQPKSKKIGAYTYAMSHGKLSWGDATRPYDCSVEDSVDELLDIIHKVLKEEC